MQSFSANANLGVLRLLIYAGFAVVGYFDDFWSGKEYETIGGMINTSMDGLKLSPYKTETEVKCSVSRHKVFDFK